MRGFRLCAATLLLGIAALGGSGCLLIPVVAGAFAGVTYSNGKLESDLPAPIAKATEASRAVLEELECTTKHKPDAADSEVAGKLPDGRLIHIELRPAGQTSSRIFIRVGTLGDKTLSQTILEKIRAKLGVK